MKRIKRKLKSKKGETLVEILVAVLIIALSAGLFATMYTASMNINLSTRRQDELLYDAVGKLEEMASPDGSDPVTGKVHYEPTGDNASDANTVGNDADIEIISKDGLFAYKNKEGTP